MSTTFPSLRRRHRELRPNIDDSSDNNSWEQWLENLREFAVLDELIAKFDEFEKELAEAVECRIETTDQEDRNEISFMVDKLTDQISGLNSRLKALERDPQLARQHEVLIDFQPHPATPDGRNFINKLVDSFVTGCQLMRDRRWEVRQVDVYAGRDISELGRMYEKGAWLSRCLRIRGIASFLSLHQHSARYVDQDANPLATVIIHPILSQHQDEPAGVSCGVYRNFSCQNKGELVIQDDKTGLTFATPDSECFKSKIQERLFWYEYLNCTSSGSPINLPRRIVDPDHKSINDDRLSEHLAIDELFTQKSSDALLRAIEGSTS